MYAMLIIYKPISATATMETIMVLSASLFTTNMGMPVDYIYNIVTVSQSLRILKEVLCDLAT